MHEPVVFIVFSDQVKPESAGFSFISRFISGRKRMLTTTFSAPLDAIYLSPPKNCEKLSIFLKKYFRLSTRRYPNLEWNVFVRAKKGGIARALIGWRESPTTNRI